jgi:hypothetical protein
LTFDGRTCDYCGKIKEENLRMTIEYLDKYKEKRYLFSEVPLIIEHDYFEYRNKIEGKGWNMYSLLAKLEDDTFNY